MEFDGEDFFHYEVIISPYALSQLEGYIRYIIEKKKNIQAAKAVKQDADETRYVLERLAGSIKFCNDNDLKKLGYRKLRFLHHRYVMIYRVNGDKVYVEAIYHELQDYENIFADHLWDSMLNNVDL